MYVSIYISAQIANLSITETAAAATLLHCAMNSRRYNEIYFETSHPFGCIPKKYIREF